MEDAGSNVVLEMLAQDWKDPVRTPLGLARKKLVAQPRACSRGRHETAGDALGDYSASTPACVWRDREAEPWEFRHALDRIAELRSWLQRSVATKVLAGNNIEAWAADNRRTPKKAIELAGRARRNLGKMP
jgi:hypothetical protein